MKRRILLLGLAAVIAPGNGLLAQGRDAEPAPPIRREEAVRLLDTWIESVLDFDRLPGISIAVVHDQELVHAKSLGFADIERRVRATPSTRYSICSLSKMFTAIALVQLRDSGLLSLDESLAEILPWLDAGDASPRLRDATLRDLLRHSSGLPCEPDRTVWSDPDSLYPSDAALVARVLQVRPSHPPGTRFNYSNLGYALLGEVVSERTGMEYAEYVREYILEPLGMSSTSPGTPKGFVETATATGYGRWPRQGARTVIVDRDSRAMAPAMGFSSTVEDLAKFAMWQFRVLDGRDAGVLSRRSLSEMHAAQWGDPEWGLGFAIWHVGGRDFAGHQGGCPGYKSQFILSPEEKVAVVVMVNATDAPQFTLAFRAHEILALSLGVATGSPRAPTPWTEFVGSYSGDEAWSDAEVLEWNGSLAVMWIPTEDPLGSLVKLEMVEGSLFRQVERDGRLGKHYSFLADSSDGEVRMKFNNNVLRKKTR